MKNWKRLVPLGIVIAASFWITSSDGVPTPIKVLFIAVLVAAPIFFVYVLIDWIFRHHPYAKKCG